jgi:hypothetical protein
MPTFHGEKGGNEIYGEIGRSKGRILELEDFAAEKIWFMTYLVAKKAS